MPRADLPLPWKRFRADVDGAVAAAQFPGALSLAVVGDATMRRVNRDFHACDEPTDVLAFPLGGAPDGFDGEVVVSLDTARREARERGEDEGTELLLYVVHGVLHLMGYDDHALSDARRMHARSLAILAGLGRTTTIRARAKPREARPRRTKGP